eukprot:TRINITY_DN7813_c0_g7_i1.p3 TRINITY_DN7813_c0_g7~~TRINITY_DN7813_c0_g7_i1.p3  ORF type:complete len:153 (-),score=46.98 TRINITY_DN7813_c0_g7_i1:699-1157(-)
MENKEEGVTAGTNLEGVPVRSGQIPENASAPLPPDNEPQDEDPLDHAEAAEVFAPYEIKDNEELKQDDAARKTFITDKEGKVERGEYKVPFTLHDLLIPGGKAAKLAKIPDVSVGDLRLSEILFRFKFREPTPVILLIGGMGTRAYVFLPSR